MGCPSNSITYNGTFCACSPGYVLNVVANSCNLFEVDSTITTDSGVDYYAFKLPESLSGFDNIKKFTQSQAVFLEATFMSLGDGRGVWFKLRWFISRLDVCFATRHWLDDKKVVTKRKTELGGAFSIASWILFIGLFAALLYQIISKRSIEVHNVVGTSQFSMGCPSNSITYNGTFCACSPGYVLNVVANSCNLFEVDSTITTDSGVDYYAFKLPESLSGFDNIKKFTQSQAVFLEATFMSLGDGRGVWFKLRWFISRLDVCFATRHWLDDKKVVTKRKTELGGAFSIASWILFIGLFAALLYQIISKRSIEVHNRKVERLSSSKILKNLHSFKSSNSMEFDGRIDNVH
ncbi:hypothetical protein RYX36_024371 [Vicia faba]